MKLKKVISLLAGKREVCGIFVSPKSTIELVLMDIDTNKIIKHKSVYFAYDVVQRNITSMQLLESTILGLLDDLNIPGNVPIVLSLPTILMGHLTVPMELSGGEIKEALISEAETNYIFKKYEPSVNWNRITINEQNETQYLLYSAFRKDEISDISNAFKKIGCNLEAIDSSYLTTLRGLAATGLISNDIQQGNIYSVLLITQTALVLMTLAGNKFIEINETPLALKSFSSEDIYPVLTNHCFDLIKNNTAEHFIIISESDEVSAEVLSTYIDLNSKKTFVEVNKYSRTPLFYGNIDFVGDRPAPISLEAVGAALWGKTAISNSLNFLSNKASSAVINGTEVKFLNKKFYLTSQIVNQLLIFLIVLVSVLYASYYLIGTSIDKSMSSTIEQLNSQINTLNTEKDKVTKESLDVKKSDLTDAILTTYSTNEKILQSYNAISSIIPDKVWIDSVEIDNGLSSAIKGKAVSVDLIMQFYQDLLSSAKFSQFKVQSIKAHTKTEQNKNNDNERYLQNLYGINPNQSNKNDENNSNLINENVRLFDFVLGNKQVSASSNSKSKSSFEQSISPQIPYMPGTIPRR